MNTGELLRDVRQAARGMYAIPGMYPMYVTLDDGEMLCRDCTRANYRSISYATRHQTRDGWQAVAVYILYETEDGPELCAHCGAELESAYGVDR